MTTNLLDRVGSAAFLAAAAPPDAALHTRTPSRVHDDRRRTRPETGVP